MKTGLAGLTETLLEVGRLGGQLGRELSRAIHPAPVVTDEGLRELRARGVRVDLEVKGGPNG